MFISWLVLIVGRLKIALAHQEWELVAYRWSPSYVLMAFNPLIMLHFWYILSFLLMFWQTKNCQWNIYCTHKTNWILTVTKIGWILQSCDPTCENLPVLPASVQKHQSECETSYKYVASNTNHHFSMSLCHLPQLQSLYIVVSCILFSWYQLFSEFYLKYFPICHDFQVHVNITMKNGCINVWVYIHHPIMGARRKADQSPPSSAKVNNVWNFSFMPLYVFMLQCLGTGENLYLSLCVYYIFISLNFLYR